MWPLISKLPAKVCNCPGHIFRLSNVHPRVGCPPRKTWSVSVESTWNNWKKNQEKKCWRKFKFGLVLLLWNGAQNFLHHGQVFSVVMCLKYALDMCTSKLSQDLLEKRQWRFRTHWNTVNIGFWNHPPSEGSRLLKPARPLKQGSGYSNQVVAKSKS